MGAHPCGLGSDPVAGAPGSGLWPPGLTGGVSQGSPVSVYFKIAHNPLSVPARYMFGKLL